MATRRLSRNPAPAEEYEDKPARRFTPRTAAAKPTAPARRTFAKSAAEEEDDAPTSVGHGWKGYKTTKEQAPSKWEKLYKVPDEDEGLIKFLEDGPYVSFLQHWCDWTAKGEQKSFVCLGNDDPDNPCPLCEVGNDPSARIRMNILDLDGETPVNCVFEVGISLADIMNKFNDDPKMGPLSRTDSYFATSKSGGKNKKTNIRPVKARDLAEDFDFDPPLDDDELEKFEKKMWSEDSLRRSTRTELQAVADKAV